MGFFSSLKERFVAPVAENKNDFVDLAASLRKTAEVVLDHIKALSALFTLELNEATGRLKQKLVWLVIAGLMALICYVSLWVLLTLLMAETLEWGWSIAIAVTMVFHLIMAIVAFLQSGKVTISPIAPATQEELQNDLSCLQMALKKSSDS